MSDATPIAERIAALAVQVATQDNDFTAEPIWVVQARDRIYGMDSDYSDSIVYIDDDGNEASPEELASIDARIAAGELWTETYYIDRWRTVQTFLTRDGAERFLRSNRHRHRELRIFSESAHRNQEMLAIREWLLSHPAAVAALALKRGKIEELRP